MNEKNAFIIRQSDGNLKVPEAIDQKSGNQFIRKNIYYTLEKISSYRFARNILAKQIEKRIYSTMVGKDTDHLYKVQLKKYHFIKALLESSLRNIDKGYFTYDSFKRLLKVFIGQSFIEPEINQKAARESFREEYEVDPPSFVVISPTQRCNLNCTNCYAVSDKHCKSTLSYPVLFKLLEEVYYKLGIRFVTISGGEPFLYRDGDKTLFDIFREFNKIFFLVYTNGTLINPAIASRLKDFGNVTPAISVEGFEEQTDQRRGANTYKKILRSFENLRNAGVPFGVSVTATSNNVETLLDDSFYDFYLDKMGATYMWQFQLMPIGKAKDSLQFMVSPKDRLRLFRKWETLLQVQNYCVADFWNSGILTDGCIAYGRKGGYVYIDWNGNITPCVFVPYSADNIYKLYDNGKSLSDALFSRFMKNGRQWQKDYGLNNQKTPGNWMMPCSIRDHYDNFRKNILTGNEISLNDEAEESMHDNNYYEGLMNYDKELNALTEDIWRDEFIKGS